MADGQRSAEKGVLDVLGCDANFEVRLRVAANPSAECLPQLASDPVGLVSSLAEETLMRSPSRRLKLRAHLPEIRNSLIALECWCW